MSMREIVKDSTSQSVVIRIIDESDGTPETGVEHNSAGIDLWYRREGGLQVGIVEVALAALDTAYTSGGIEHMGHGYYRLDVPDAAFVIGVNGVMIGGTVTGMVVIGCYVPLVNFDKYGIAADNIQDQYDTTGLAGGTFPATQDQLSGISNVGSAVNVSAESYTLTTGTQSSGTFASTAALDGTNHEHTDNAGVMDLYYEFQIGSGTPASVVVTGYLTGINDDLEVYGWDWVASGWVQIGQMAGMAVGSNEVNAYDLFVNMVGTAGDLGKVRIRFTDGAFTLTTATLAIDQIFVSFSLGVSGYENGAIWVDTNASNTNTVVGVDGVAGNPVSTWAAALTLSAATNLERFHIASGSTITLSGNTDNYTLFGEEWTLILAGQSCDDAAFMGAHVTGICTGGEVVFRDCDLASGGGTLTCAGLEAHGCAIAGSIVLTAANAFFLNQCYSGVAGTSTPDLDFGAAVGNQQVNFRHYSGGIEIKNMGANGTDNMSLEGHGQLVLNANCDPSNSPVIAIRGHFNITDNVAGGFVAGGGTISDPARFDQDQILEAVTDDDTKITATQLNAHTAITPATVGAEMNLADDAITAAKYDESTAFPVKADDTGATQIARVGADSDTLETLSDQIDGTNTVTPDPVGTAAGLHATTDGLINAVKAVVDAVLVDTALMDKWLNNVIEFDDTANTMTLMDDDGITPLITYTLTQGTLAVSGPYNRSAGV